MSPGECWNKTWRTRLQNDRKVRNPNWSARQAVRPTVFNGLSPSGRRRIEPGKGPPSQRLLGHYQGTYRNAAAQTPPLKSSNPTLIILFWLAANTAVGISTATDLPFRSSKPSSRISRRSRWPKYLRSCLGLGTSPHAFPLEDAEYRNKVEDVIECMKLDGRLGKLHEKWYGTAPDSGSAIDTVYFGYGPPGFKGFEPTAHVPSCK